METTQGVSDPLSYSRLLPDLQYTFENVIYHLNATLFINDQETAWKGIYEGSSEAIIM